MSNMKTIRLTKHEAAIMTWLLATPTGTKARGFTVVIKSGRTHLEVTEVFDLVWLVNDALDVRDMTSVGWKEASVLSLRGKVHAADINLGDTTTGATTS